MPHEHVFFHSMNRALLPRYSHAVLARDRHWRANSVRISLQWKGESIGSFDIVVNATPIGMAGVTEDPLPIDLVLSDRVRLVYDLVTSPEPTPLVRTARQAGIETITGVEMLVAQAARQFEIWTGERAPVSVMENAAFR